MKYEKMPYGDPIYFEGKYEKDNIYDLYIQNISCCFTLKKDKIPTIQLKNSRNFLSNEYVIDSGFEPQMLTLTNVDLELFFEHYDVDEKSLAYLGGWKFKSINGLFTKYVDFWTERKIQAKKEGNAGIYILSKLMLNSLYGKFALNPVVKSKGVFLSSENIVKYFSNEEEERNRYIFTGTAPVLLLLHMQEIKQFVQVKLLRNIVLINMEKICTVIVIRIQYTLYYQ